MMERFQNLFEGGPLYTVGMLVFLLALYVAFALVPICAVIYVVYALLTRPMRRNERARMFLDLLELGLKEGRAPERAIAGAAASGDPSLGKGFFALARYLDEGLRLDQALDAAPQLLSPQLRAMLKTGAKIGDLAKVLPACRQLLKDGVSHVRGALNYLLVLLLLVMPLTTFVPLVLRVKVLPQFKAIFQGMLGGGALPAFTRFVFDQSDLFIGVQLGVIGLFWLALFGYVGGPRFQAWVNVILPGVPDRLLTRLPWRRKRLQRDFSAMLAVLLDAEIPEAEAVKLAASATANATMERRAAKVCAKLAAGAKLPDALRAMDDSPELRWRLANAIQRGSGFLGALAGWHEALDAKAFQLEQSAAQVTTAAVVLFNGAIVAGIMIAVFLALTDLINQVALW